MNTTSGRIDVGEMFKKTLKAGLDIIIQGVIQTGSEIPAVQKAVEQQKVVAGKNILWKYFPYIFIGLLGLFMVARIK